MQRRDGAGRYAAMPARAPEVALGGAIVPGASVKFGGVFGHRVIEVDGDTLTLRPPRGGRAIAMVSDVTVHPETPEEQESNLREEANIARLLGSVKALSRQRREELDRDAGPDRQDALGDLSRKFYDGTVSLERYVYAMRSTEGAPLAANHAALAIVMRRHLSAEQYEALTAPARRAGATLPD